MKSRIYVPTSPQVLSALVRLAARERRRVNVQAALLLERALGIANEAEDEPATPEEHAAERVRR